MNFNRIFSSNGIGPGTWSFNTKGSDQLLIISGSAYSHQQNSDVTVDVLVDAKKVGQLFIHSNGNRTHRAFVTLMVPLKLNSEQHILDLHQSNNAVIDSHDYFDILLIDA